MIQGRWIRHVSWRLGAVGVAVGAALGLATLYPAGSASADNGGCGIQLTSSSSVQDRLAARGQAASCVQQVAAPAGDTGTRGRNTGVQQPVFQTNNAGPQLQQSSPAPGPVRFNRNAASDNQSDPVAPIWQNSSPAINWQSSVAPDPVVQQTRERRSQPQEYVWQQTTTPVEVLSFGVDPAPQIQFVAPQFSAQAQLPEPLVPDTFSTTQNRRSRNNSTSNTAAAPVTNFAAPVVSPAFTGQASTNQTASLDPEPQTSAAQASTASTDSTDPPVQQSSAPAGGVAGLPHYNYPPSWWYNTTWGGPTCTQYGCWNCGPYGCPVTYNCSYYNNCAAPYSCTWYNNCAQYNCSYYNNCCSNSCAPYQCPVSNCAPYYNCPQYGCAPFHHAPPVVHRTVYSCADLQPFYARGFPHGQMPYGQMPHGQMAYGQMPYGYNPQVNYPFGQYPYAFNASMHGQTYYNYPTMYPGLYGNVGYGQPGYPYGHQVSSYSQTIHGPHAILVIHHVVVNCAPPRPAYQAPVQTAPSYQPVGYAAQAVAAQAVYAAPVQQRGGLQPPRTGSAGLANVVDVEGNSVLPGFVLIALLTLLSTAFMVRVRQK